MRGIGGEGFLFSTLGYRRGIASRRKYVSCLALSCLVAAAAAAAAATAATAAGSAGPAAAVAAAYLPTTELPAPQGVAPVSLVGRFTLTVVVVKLASHCVFNKIIQNNLKEWLHNSNIIIQKSFKIIFNKSSTIWFLILEP